MQARLTRSITCILLPLGLSPALTSPTRITACVHLIPAARAPTLAAPTRTNAHLVPAPSLFLTARAYRLAFPTARKFVIKFARECEIDDSKLDLLRRLRTLHAFGVTIPPICLAVACRFQRHTIARYLIGIGVPVLYSLREAGGWTWPYDFSSAPLPEDVIKALIRGAHALQRDGQHALYCCAKSGKTLSRTHANFSRLARQHYIIRRAMRKQARHIILSWIGDRNGFPTDEIPTIARYVA